MKNASQVSIFQNPLPQTYGSLMEQYLDELKRLGKSKGEREAFIAKWGLECSEDVSKWVVDGECEVVK